MVDELDDTISRLGFTTVSVSMCLDTHDVEADVDAAERKSEEEESTMAGGSEVIEELRAGEDNTTAGGSDIALEFNVFDEGPDGVARVEDGREVGMDAGVVGTGAMPVIDSSEPVDGVGSASVDKASCGVVVAAMVVVIVECMVCMEADPAGKSGSKSMACTFSGSTALFLAFFRL